MRGLRVHAGWRGDSSPQHLACGTAHSRCSVAACRTALKSAGTANQPATRGLGDGARAGSPDVKLPGSPDLRAHRG